jgi:predicted PurR-regulated permease PerM
MSEQEPSSPPAESAEKLRLFRWFFFGVFAFLLYQLLLILSLFSNVIIWAVSLTLVFWPAYRMLQKRMPQSSTGASLLFTTGVSLLVLLPVLALFWVMIAQSAQLYPTVNHWIGDLNTRAHGDVIGLLPDWMQTRWTQLRSYLQSNPALAQYDPQQFLLSKTDALSSRLADLGAATARNILLGIVNLTLIVVLMFFCFRDGERFLQWLFSIIPMQREQTESVAMRIYLTTTAVIRGAMLTSVAQGILAIIGYLIAGVPLAVLFGVLTGLAGMIPVVGGGLIWLPVGLFMMTESEGWGIFVILWGLILISMSDNVIKAMFIGKEAGMPVLLIFCSMLGGVNVYGFTGLIVGPILMAVLMSFIAIYREQYLVEKTPGQDSG